VTDKTYIVATIRPWNIRIFEETIRNLPGQWELVTRPSDLTIETIRRLAPRFVFFPHWSHKVPREILESAECVCFHETDLPYGRGGSPVQNLIARGHRATVVSALRMVEELDAGPVYLKRRLSLEGLGEEIFVRASKIIAEMIEEIVKTEPEPVDQAGDPTLFKRRTPDESKVSADLQTLEEVFDHIRMLDAEGYPRSFIEAGGFRFELSRPALRTDCVVADVRITRPERS
jgi:methionyl-tRNA formyltransferase